MSGSTRTAYPFVGVCVALALAAMPLVSPSAAGASKGSMFNLRGDVVPRASAAPHPGDWLVPATSAAMVIRENEEAGRAGDNDSPALGERVEGLGELALSTPSGIGLARLVGNLASTTSDQLGAIDIAEDVRRTVEDDGSIPLANQTDLVPRATVSFQGTIGDGPFGDSSGDLDFFALGFLDEGETVLVDVDAAVDRSTLDSYVTLYDESGAVIATADDDGESLDSLLETEVPFSGTYFVSVAACCGFPSDPFDSGASIIAGTTGPYVVTLGIGVSRRVNSVDIDTYLVDLEPGDVVSAGFAGVIRTATMVDPTGEIVMVSDRNLSQLYPGTSPLRHLGDVGLDHVAAVAGTHAIVIAGREGSYHGEVRLSRIAPDRSLGTQKVFLDFDGAELDASILDGDPNAVLSPLSSFLFRWGLLPDEEDRLVDAIVLTVVENLISDLRRANANRRFDFQILNSRDHPDAWGTANVTRVVIGGAVEETGLSTIGLAQSIDPGNFDREETAVVLLDLLSDSAGFSDSSLNDIERADGSDRIDLIGRTIGNVASHELGHLLGNYHTEAFNGVPSLMDAGGDLFGVIGTGPDRVFGSADDIDVDFGRDDFDPSEGLSGVQDTRTRARFGLTALRLYDVIPTKDPGLEGH